MSRIRSANAFALLLAAAIGAAPATAHELWVEADAAGPIGRPQSVRVGWGHSGESEAAERLAQQRSKLSARVVGPGGAVEPLELALGSDSFDARFTPETPGRHLVGAEMQTGIVDREFHGIPAGTRIVMYGATSIRIADASAGRNNALGFDLEIVPVTDPAGLQPGDVVTVKVLLRGKPIGGRRAVVALATAGPNAPDDPRLASKHWSIEAHPDPRTGEVSFPLLAAGEHLFSIKYFDETPGVYEGDLEEVSSFSHLRKGDKFEQTMFVSTYTCHVADK